MSHDVAFFGFPLWLRLTHYVNFLFLTLLVRSGIQILSDHPKLYWNKHCTPGSEWIKFSKNAIPKGKLWTSMDEAVDVSPWIALPGGRHNLGIGRHWHFFAVAFWVLNGLVYVALLFGTGGWRRLIPTSWDFFPAAWHTFLSYATLHLPPAGTLHPYNPLQQLTYAAVVFVLAPLSILTGAAMSPAVDARFPWYPRLFGNRQKARSLHFLAMVAYVIFIPIHIALVAIEDFPQKMDQVVLGLEHQHVALAVYLGLVSIAVVVAIHVLLTWWSQRRPRTVQHLSGILTDWLTHLLLYRLTSRQEYTQADISPYFWVNGRPPVSEEWSELAKDGFACWKLQVTGLVEQPLLLSLAELRAMPLKRQITQHCCIQGWSAFAEWTGVPLAEILKRCRALPQARYLIFHSHQVDEQGREYYGSLDIEEAKHPQTILAYEMNGAPLLMNHGAPLRLRVETKLGFKMVKWLKTIELVEDYRTVGEGYGGYREDVEYYGTGAEI
jgi:DMSO/TMAO reductase YedYZ molybdopterin-dependent catalytic subunit/thiosulfate reductase cytochrome b subunit